MNEILIPLIKGVLVALFIAATTDLTITDFKWWVAMLSLSATVNI